MQVIKTIMRLFRRNQSQALIDAVVKGDTTQVARLLAQGSASPNTKREDGKSVLDLAAWNGHVEVVKTLLDHGADVNLLNDERPGRPLWTALNSAALNGHGQVVRLLLCQGASEGKIHAVMQAAMGGHVEIVLEFLKHGMNPNVRTEGVGRTILMTAALHGRVAVVQALLETGSDVHSKGAEGKTALQFATDKGHSEVIELLKPHAASASQGDPTVAPSDSSTSNVRDLAKSLRVGMTLEDVIVLLGPPDAQMGGGAMLGQFGKVSGSRRGIFSLTEKTFCIWNRPEGEYKLVIQRGKLLEIYSAPQ